MFAESVGMGFEAVKSILIIDTTTTACVDVESEWFESRLGFAHEFVIMRHAQGPPTGCDSPSLVTSGRNHETLRSLACCITIDPSSI
jgi:hypothetical protein